MTDAGYAGFGGIEAARSLIGVLVCGPTHWAVVAAVRLQLQRSVAVGLRFVAAYLEQPQSAVAPHVQSAVAPHVQSAVAVVHSLVAEHNFRSPRYVCAGCSLPSMHDDSRWWKAAGFPQRLHE
jgi:hypothetical protein